MAEAYPDTERRFSLQLLELHLTSAADAGSQSEPGIAALKRCAAQKSHPRIPRHNLTSQSHPTSALPSLCANSDTRLPSMLGCSLPKAYCDLGRDLASNSLRGAS